MNNIIKIENLNFKYGETEIFENLNLTIKENTFTTILGPNGSGKTTLVKLLLGSEKADGKVVIDKLPVIKDNLNHIDRFTNLIPEKLVFKADTVIEEFNNALISKKFIKKQFQKNIDQITELLEINNLLEKNPNTLNLNDQLLVAIAATLITKPKLLIIDQTLTILNETEKKKVLKLFQKMIKNKELTVVYMTSDSDESLYGDNIIILGRKNVLVSGKKDKIFKDEKNFKKAGLELPFIIELSKKLQFYNLIDKDYQSAEKMVKDLWK